MSIELWRDVPGFPGYQASDHWRIRSVDRVTCHGQRRRGRVLKQVRPIRHRHLYVCLSVDGIKYFVKVDDLVLAAWGEQQVRSFPRGAAA
jgi:NUMOD4 motif